MWLQIAGPSLVLTPPSTLIPAPQEAMSTVHVIYMVPVGASRYKRNKLVLSTLSAGEREIRWFPRGRGRNHDSLVFWYFGQYRFFHLKTPIRSPRSLAKVMP